MKTLSVVIPFFQRKPGVLGKTLQSLEAQTIPQGWQLRAVLIDDGSPLPARQEVVGYELTGPRTMHLVEQVNSGVGAARNHGLKIAVPKSDAIAFLDSDDIWPSDHVARAIAALDEGFDFYFTDNRRAGSHESHVRSTRVPRSAKLISEENKNSGIVELPIDKIVGLSLREFPCQASTVVYRKKIAPLLRFSTHLKSSSEDVLFFTELLARSSRVGFDLDSVVECGESINIFFSNLGWDASRLLNIKVDQFLTHGVLDKAGFLDENNKALNEGRIKTFTGELNFHLVRNLLKNPEKATPQAWRLLKTDLGAGIRVFAGFPQAIVGKLLGKSALAEAD